MNLLAVIYQDGGHYTKKHGLEKSAQDAQARVYGARAEVKSKTDWFRQRAEEATAEVERLTQEVQEALSDAAIHHELYHGCCEARDVFATRADKAEQLIKRCLDQEIEAARLRVEVTDLRRTANHFRVKRDKAEAVVRAAEEVKAMFHPKGPDDGTCYICTLAGGKHSGSCCIGHVVEALAVYTAHIPLTSLSSYAGGDVIATPSREQA